MKIIAFILASRARVPPLRRPRMTAPCCSRNAAAATSLIRRRCCQQRPGVRCLAGLDRHYGVDASLDEESLAAVRRASCMRRELSGAQVTRTTALPRITTSAWFREEHDEVGADAWRRPAVKGAANCDSCHQDAARGDFEEDNVRFPGEVAMNEKTAGLGPAGRAFSS